MKGNIPVDPLVLTNEDKVKNVHKRLIVGIVVLVSTAILFSCFGWTSKLVIVYFWGVLTTLYHFHDFRKKKKSITEREEYLRIDENGVRVNSEGIQEFIEWDDVEDITFYAFRKHENIYHMTIKYKDGKNTGVIRMDLGDYNEIISNRKWKKAIIHFSGRDDIVGNKHTWLIFAKEDND